MLVDLCKSPNSSNLHHVTAFVLLAWYVPVFARGFVTHKILSKEECEKLDKEARDIGREVANVVQIAPRDKWSPGFAA